MNTIHPIETIPHCRALTGVKHEYSEHFESDNKAFAYALNNNYNIIVHYTAKPSMRKYYFAKRDLSKMTNLSSVQLQENKSAFDCTTWVIRS